MLNEEKLRELPEPAQTYWRKAWKFLNEKQTGWEAITFGTEEYDDWVKYFRRMGWMPFGIRMLRERKCETFLVPARRPQWFDLSYTPI